MGLHQAMPDAEIVGVDIAAQKHYPFEFVQADALTFPLDGFDFIWASPPCQGYSIMRNLPWLRDRDYPLLIEASRERLEAWGGPYVIENVMGARNKVESMRAGWLCGQMFGLPFFRHRLFATNWPWLQPFHAPHRGRVRTTGATSERRRRGISEQIIAHGRLLRGRADPARGVVVASLAAWQQGNGAQARGVGVGHAAGWRLAADAMGIDWMDRAGLTQAIPPAYSRYIAEAWLAQQERVA